MEAKTLQALKESIAHWERMRDGKQYPGEAPDAIHCALCKLYYGDPEEPSCVGCPIFEKTGLVDCNGTPFRSARKWWYTRNKPKDFDESEFKKAAQAMIDYLKSLLPTTEQEGCGE